MSPSTGLLRPDLNGRRFATEKGATRSMLSIDERRTRYVRRVVANETKWLAQTLHTPNFDDRLFACAAKFGNYVAQGCLPAPDAEEALWAVARNARGETGQLRRTIKRGLARGIDDPTLAKFPPQLTLKEAS